MTLISHNDKRIADLDPLGADGFMTMVPQFNANRDLNSLVDLLNTLCKRVNLNLRTHDEVLAIVRDLGIVAGSIRRHGPDPVSLVPELEIALLKSAQLTDLPARDTLMHYTIWNPNGPRLRTYTNHEQEPTLIESMRISLPAISSATRKLFQMQTLDLQNQRTARIADSIGNDLKVFISGLNYSKNNVKPDIFINHFRPFFEPFTVGDCTLRGPGAVTMPLHIFDFILWGTSESSEAYQKFTVDYIPYNLSEFRHYYLETRNTPSFLDRLESECHDATRTEMQPLLGAVETWFKRLRGFRGAHLKYANKAYHGPTKHNFKNGSGGHTTSDIEAIAHLTQKHAARLNSLITRKDSLC